MSEPLYSQPSVGQPSRLPRASGIPRVFPPPHGLSAFLLLLIAFGSVLNPAADAQTAELRQTSVPVGIINQTTAVSLNSVAETLTAAENSTTYTFCYWTLNAVRWADASGGAQNPARFNVAGAVDAVAKYVPTTEDKDDDGLPDWWEYRHFGDLDQTGADNPDGDAFINSDEFLRRLPPHIHNLHQHGYESRRPSAPFTVIQKRDVFAVLTETSVPAGVLQQSRVVPKGVSVTLTNPPTPFYGYQFTGWLLNGTRYDRPADPQPLTITPAGDMSLVARYIPSDADFDFDGLLDWKELLWFDGLQHSNASDPDGDSFTIADEESRSFSSLAADELIRGGLSRRASAAFYVDTIGRLPFHIASDPATILDQTEYHPFNSLVNVTDKTNHTSGPYQFAWWDLDGTRQEDPSGAAIGGFKFTLQIASTATAHYVDPLLDSDYDGIKDWQEWTYFGALAQRSISDPDDDGFTFEEELKRGQAPQVHDTLALGGIARRGSAPFFVDTTRRLSLLTTSNPISILYNQQYFPSGSLISIPDVSSTAPIGYQFSWWTVNGIRQEDPSGSALRSLTFSLNTNTDLIGHYIDPELDSDYDGIKDWHEWTYFGTLDHGPASDTDGDKFAYAEELVRSQSPQVADEMPAGGISRRSGATLTIDPMVAAAEPVIGSLRSSNISTTSANISALVNPMSAATSASFEYGEIGGPAATIPATSILNGFIADSMSAVLTNLKPGTHYFFRVTATNALGPTTSENSTFRTLSSRTPYQHWAAIYSITNPTGDADGDGVPNLVEYAFGMHPRLASDLWRLPVIELIGGRFRLSVTAPSSVTDVTYGAEWSADLATWHRITDSGAGTYHEFLTPPDLQSSNKVFVRWAVKLIP